MNWGCKYQSTKNKEVFCELLKKECKPGQPKCILVKKVKFLKLNEGGIIYETRSRKSNSRS